MKEFLSLEEVKEYNSENSYKEICEVCFQNWAEWFYMPSDHPEKPSCFCDNCVPRGCSCNWELKDDSKYDDEEYCNNPDNWKELKDEKGRLLPCCECWHYPLDKR